jgi:hypothetical protein
MRSLRLRDLHICKKKKQGARAPYCVFSLFGGPARDGFDFEEILDAPNAALAAIA